MKHAINTLLFLILLALIAAMLFLPLAHATGKPEPTPAGQSQALDLSLMNTANGGAGYGGAGFGGSSRNESYSLVSSGSAAPLPTGLCPKGDSSYVQILWGLLTVANSSTRTEMECLDKVLAMFRDTAPKPQVVNYLQPPIPAVPVTVNVTQPEPAKCEAPKPAPKKAAKKFSPAACPVK